MVDVSTVVATHLSHLIHLQAASLLGIQELHQLLEHVAKSAPKLTEELIPKVLSHAVLQKVLQNLLDEGVPIRDMRSILETLSKYVPMSQDPIYLTAQVRVALGPAIIQQLYPASQELQVIAMDKELEHLLAQAMQAGGLQQAIEPGLADTLLRETRLAAERQEMMGFPTVLLVPGQLRDLLARFLKRTLPQLKVVAQDEVPGFRTVKVTSLVGGRV